ncbi:hypothetical protein [Clostridium aciditolerans]|uniref:Uncharacterized protein n=1 Tax=Clostridium aciditolerans TaxID=339861 RepID=A0A934M405_9CLOT|nr:hypothetical protein [Clostridium aciditolerans]MBI6872113.1 hypothetical protein [Clostridium aciditolerans]
MEFVLRKNIKSVISLLFITIFILFLPSCSKENKDGRKEHKDGTIVKANLTDKEQQLIRGFGADKQFVFDVNLQNKDINWVECWVDYYENGKFKNKILRSGTQINFKSESSGMLIFSTQNGFSKREEEKWTLSYSTKGGSGTGSMVITKPKIYTSSSFSAREEGEIIIGEPINLAFIVEGDNVSSTPIDIFNKSNISSEELAQCNSVYIFRCKFIHK